MFQYVKQKVEKIFYTYTHRYTLKNFREGAASENWKNPEGSTTISFQPIPSSRWKQFPRSTFQWKSLADQIKPTPHAVY